MTLIERIKSRLRMIKLGFTMSPIAGAEEEGGEGGEGGEGKPAGEGSPGGGSGEGGEEKKPPWGDDKDFDPQRAWSKLQALEGDKGKAQERAEKAEAELKKRQDAEKTEAEKLEERASTAEKKATQAEATALRLDVALDKAPEGMSIAQVRKLAKRLSGESREDLEADAEELFADFAPADDEGQGPRRRPRERLRPGASPSSEPEETDPDKLAATVPRMY